MTGFVLAGDTSGQIAVNAPAVAGTNTLTLLAATATNSVNTLGTAVASTSGTSIDFTGLPSWIKRITIMFNGVSGNASSNLLVQIGSGSVTTSGYASQGSYTTTGTNLATSTIGFVVWRDAASYALTGHMILTNISSNTWIESHTGTIASNVNVYGAGSSPSLSGALDRVRITTVNGTDTFDAGTVNILYEG